MSASLQVANTLALLRLDAYADLLLAGAEEDDIEFFGEQIRPHVHLTGLRWRGKTVWLCRSSYDPEARILRAHPDWTGLEDTAQGALDTLSSAA